MLNPGEIYLGDVVFKLDSRDLHDGHGNRIDLRNKSSEVLACLAARAGDIVSKSELLECAWPDTTVTDESLTQCIADIRRAIGDSDQTLLQTFVGKGYSLNAATAEGTYSCIDGKAAVDVTVAGLVPNAVYTMWNFIDAEPPTEPWQTIMFPLGARDGSDASFNTDSVGNAVFSARFEPFP